LALHIVFACRTMTKTFAVAALSTSLLFAVASGADAQDADLARCAAVASDIARLQCYDNLAESAGAGGDSGGETTSCTAQAPCTVGEWIIREETNPVNDNRIVMVALRSASGTNRMGGQIALILRCIRRVTDLMINWQAYLGSEANVLTRVGVEEAETSSWGLSGDSQATFLPGNSDVEFVQRLLDVDQLVAQVTPYNENPITAVFELDGIQEAIIPLREACEW